MNRKGIIILLSFFVLSFTEKEPNNDAYKYHCIYVPDEKLVNIEIDGILNDWEWVPDRYLINASQLMFKKGYSINKEDLDGYFFVGWNKITNWIYIVAEIYDNNLDTANNAYMDKFEFQANPSNSMQKLNSNVLAFEFYKKTNGEDLANNIIDSEGNWMLNLDENAKWAINIEKDSIQAKNKITYEIGIQLWDEWSPMGEVYSINHVLEENQIIGLVLIAIDSDLDEEQSLMYTVGGSGGRYKGYTFYMSNFILDPLIYSTNKVDGMIQLINDNSMILNNE